MKSNLLETKNKAQSTVIIKTSAITYYRISQFKLFKGKTISLL